MHFSQEIHQQQYTQELKELSLWPCGRIAYTCEGYTLVSIFLLAFWKISVLQ